MAYSTPPLKSIVSRLNSFFTSIAGRRLHGWQNKDYLVESQTSLRATVISAAVNWFVLQQLASLKANKAIGLDKISTRLLKSSANTITPSIAKLSNLSIRTGKFPKLWTYQQRVVTDILFDFSQENFHSGSRVPSWSLYSSAASSQYLKSKKKSAK